MQIQKAAKYIINKTKIELNEKKKKKNVMIAIDALGQNETL